MKRIFCLHRQHLLLKGTCDCGDGDIWECGNPKVKVLYALGEAPQIIGRACCPEFCKFCLAGELSEREYGAVLAQRTAI